MMKIGVCGSTERTVQCVNSLASDARFEISWVVTPPPKPVGRKQHITPSPLESWARERNIPVIHVEKSLKPLQPLLEEQSPVDFLLVVDFGYLVPQWLLDLPKIAPINVHPSDLPKYRGSSPAQFALLYGETESAVCIMRMTAGLDEGPIIQSLPFSVDSNETAESYYRKAFVIAANALPETLVRYAENRAETAQPEKSTTPVAKRFSREDGYIPYSIIEDIQNSSPAKKEGLGPILSEVLALQPSATVVQLVERAVRALSPWPGVWTVVPEYKGRTNIRCKIISAHINNGRFVIDEQKFDGE